MIAWLCVQNTPTSGSHARQLLRSYYCISPTIKTSSNTIRPKQRLSLSVKPCLKLVFSTHKMVACGFELCVVGQTSAPRHLQNKSPTRQRANKEIVCVDAKKGKHNIYSKMLSKECIILFPKLRSVVSADVLSNTCMISSQNNCITYHQFTRNEVRLFKEPVNSQLVCGLGGLCVLAVSVLLYNSFLYRFLYFLPDVHVFSSGKLDQKYLILLKCKTENKQILLVLKEYFRRLFCWQSETWSDV